MLQGPGPLFQPELLIKGFVTRALVGRRIKVPAVASVPVAFGAVQQNRLPVWRLIARGEIYSFRPAVAGEMKVCVLEPVISCRYGPEDAVSRFSKAGDGFFQGHRDDVRIDKDKILKQAIIV